ncbi:MAG: energy transducer TonB, partial [Gammaproteobacteria bacterium]
MSRVVTSLRFLVSALLAGALLLFGGGWLVHHYLGHEPVQTVSLKVVRGIEFIRHLPGSATAAAPEKKGPVLNGFVQIAFTVGADGRAHNIHVLRAMPPGEYEEAAREIVAARRFKPQESA